MRFKFIALLLFFISISIVASVGTPAIYENDQIIEHKYYTLKYNEEREQPDWVAYFITKEMITEGKSKRKNNFREDPTIVTGSASLKDYRKSGYDRGHLCPAAAMKISDEAMSETFYMSNMSPQKPYFNRGIWKQLESKVRTWAVKNDKIYFVTGPIFYKDKEHVEIGSNGVDVPDAYYKVILDFRMPEIKAIGFIMPNEKTDNPIAYFSLSVDDVENVTGIDFFKQLPDNAEEQLESRADYNQW